MDILTPRLRLREFTTSDVDAIAAYRVHPDYLEHYRRGPFTRQECEDFVRTCVSWAEERPRLRYQLVICDRRTDSLIGNCGVRKLGGGCEAAEVGYELAPEWWGRGYATEAVERVVRFGFEGLDLDEMRARVNPANGRSVRLLARVGFGRVEEPGDGDDVTYVLSRAAWEGAR